MIADNNIIYSFSRDWMIVLKIKFVLCIFYRLNFVGDFDRFFGKFPQRLIDIQIAREGDFRSNPN